MIFAACSTVNIFRIILNFIRGRDHHIILDLRLRQDRCRNGILGEGFVLLKQFTDFFIDFHFVPLSLASG